MKKVTLALVVILTLSSSLLAQDQAQDQEKPKPVVSPPGISIELENNRSSYETYYRINKIKIDKHRRSKWGFLGSAIGVGAIGTLASSIAFSQEPPSLTISYISAGLQVLAGILGVGFIYHDYKLDLIQSEVNSFGVSLSKKI